MSATDMKWKRTDKAAEAKRQVRWITIVMPKFRPPSIPKWLQGAGTSYVKGTRERYRHATASGPGIMPYSRHRVGRARLTRAESNHHPSYLEMDRMTRRLIGEGHPTPAKHARRHAQ